MPLLRSLAGYCDDRGYKHAAPTELGGYWDARGYKHGAPPELAEERNPDLQVRLQSAGHDASCGCGDRQKKSRPPATSTREPRLARVCSLKSRHDSTLLAP